MGHALYQGRVSIDFVGRKWLWYAMSGLIVLVAVLGLTVKGLNMGIEFEGGVEYRVSMASGAANQTAVNDITDAVTGTGIDAAASPIVNTSGENLVRVQTEPLSISQSNAIDRAIRGVDNVKDLSSDQIGPSWGRQVAQRALLGLVVFVFLVVLLIWGYFREWKMSVAAMVALAHDLVITVGVYALSGFEVTPATVTGILTILGFSLYDTVVVFDKVRENTRNITASTRRTYSESANLALNQTLVRSINTSVAALLPVGAILYVGAFQLGSGPLKDLALALFVGTAAGAYSSIFIATPLLAQLKMREPAMQAQAKRVYARRGAEGRMVVSETGISDSQQDVETTDDGDRTESGRPAASRTATKVARPMSSSASKRAQPQRRARSKRGKR
jgi:preprotein translocase subunit SecF